MLLERPRAKLQSKIVYFNCSEHYHVHTWVLSYIYKNINHISKIYKSYYNINAIPLCTDRNWSPRIISMPLLSSLFSCHSPPKSRLRRNSLNRYPTRLSPSICPLFFAVPTIGEAFLHWANVVTARKNTRRNTATKFMLQTTSVWNCSKNLFWSCTNITNEKIQHYNGTKWERNNFLHKSS